jgi:hypothetical protein
MFTRITFVMLAVGLAGCGYCVESYLATGEDNAVLFAICMVVAALSFGELREAIGRKVGQPE